MPDMQPGLDLSAVLGAAVAHALKARGGPDAARRALGVLDFTSLNDGDTEESVARFLDRARMPRGPVAAVCLWPRFVTQARRALDGSGIRIACVANFPGGGTDAAAVASEIREAVAAGTDEVDVVLPYHAFLAGDARAAAAVIAAARAACGADVRLKVILETGAMDRAAAIVAAARLAIAEGADFIKTSTGKRTPGASPQAAALMLDIIRETPGRTVGLKPAGGIRTTADAAIFMALAEAILGPSAVAPDRFRIGASSLLTDLLAVLGQDAPAAVETGGY
jgi:deoxyribose-phosphate aldolase